MFEKGKKYKIKEKAEIFLDEEIVSIEKDTVFRCKETGQQPILVDVVTNKTLPRQAATHLQNLLFWDKGRNLDRGEFDYENYTKEELEAQLEPVACKLPKEECPQGQDIVQVTLPWLDDANDCIEVYLIRKKNGIIELVYD